VAETLGAVRYAGTVMRGREHGAILYK
jgi:hypothetical protein